MDGPRATRTAKEGQSGNIGEKMRVCVSSNNAFVSAYVGMLKRDRCKGKRHRKSKV